MRDKLIRVEASVETKLDNDQKVAYAGTRFGFDIPEDGKLTVEELHAQLDSWMATFEITPARALDLIDGNVTNVRFYQDAGRLQLRDTGKAFASDEEWDEIAKERAQAAGRGGARGPRLSDQEVIAAVAGLVKSNAAFQPLQDFVNGAKLSELAAAVAKLRADFTAAGLTVEQIKAFAKS